MNTQLKSSVGRGRFDQPEPPGAVIAGFLEAWQHVLLLALAWLLMPAAVEAQPHLLNESWRWMRYTKASGLPSTQVRDLIETSNGQLWALTDLGLAWYDEYRWRHLGERSVSRIVPDLQGRVLALSGDSFYRVSTRGFERVPVVYEERTLRVNSMAALEPEVLLLQTEAGLFRYREGHLEAMPVPDGLMSWPQDGTNIQRTRSGTVWLNTRKAGLFRWEADRWVPWMGKGTLHLREDSLGGILGAETVAEKQGLWTWQAEQHAPYQEHTPLVTAMDLSPTGEGIVVFVDGTVWIRQQGRWEELADVPEELSHPRFVRYRRNGDLWVGGENDLYVFRRALSRWTPGPGGETAAGRQVNALLITRHGELWIGTGDVLIILRTDGTVERLKAILGTPLQVITGLAEDPWGGIWVSSGGGFDGAFRRHEGNWTHVGPKDGLLSQRIHRIVPDRKGRLWFLGLAPRLYDPDYPEPGAFVYDGKGFTRWGVEEGLLNGRVYTFAEGAHGDLWFGTNEGLSRWQDGAWKHWSRGDGLRVKRIFTLAADDEGRIWFGDQRSGLGYIDEEEQPQYLTVADGLIDDRVLEIQRGPDGSLWIATMGGLSRYREGLFSSFGPSTGLEHARLWPVLPLPDRVYVGTLGGGTYALGLAEATNPPPLVEIEAPVIDARQAFFRWAAYSYRSEMPPDQVETRTRLDDHVWSPWSRARETSVMNLAPGRHTFTVQAKSLFGHVKAEGASITFKIAPPFYQHPLFMAGLLLWLAGMVAFGATSWRNRRRHHALLRQREASLAEAQRIARIGNWERDFASKQVYFSDEVFRILGRDPQGTTPTFEEFLQIVHPADRERIRQSFEKALEGAPPPVFEHRILLPNGRERIVKQRTEVLFDEAGRPVLMRGTIQDITERKRAEEAVRQAQAALLHQQKSDTQRVEEELAKVKETLIRQTRLATIGQVAASIAHELRNPLGAVRNANYYLRHCLSADQPKWDEYLQIIEDEVTTAEQIISDLLEMNHAKAPAKHAVSLREAVREAFGKVRGHEGVALQCDFEPSEFIISVDPRQFRQVLVNLFSNAVQAMEGSGWIEVEARRAGGWEVITVRDDGPGIAAEARAQVFEPLYTTKAKGTGLGLSICRQIVARHGGHLDVVQQERAGAAFAMQLPTQDVNIAKGRETHARTR